VTKGKREISFDELAKVALLIWDNSDKGRLSGKK
jgi:hypothetical protein